MSSCYNCIGSWAPCLPRADNSSVTKELRATLERSTKDRAIDIVTLLLHPNPTRPISKSYKTLGKIGAGSFGTVFKAEVVGQPNDFRAVKVVTKTDVAIDMKLVVTEVEAMLRLSHPNIVKFFEYFEDSKAIYLITELCTGGDFSDLHADKMLPHEIRSLFKGVLLGVCYCHSLGIAHRDLKFENCLISVDSRGNKTAKVIDFGLAAIRREGETRDKWATDSLGTKYFVAPEVLDREPKYGVKCDIWSLGVMFYIILTDEHPIAKNATGLQTKQLFRLIRRGGVRLEPLEAHKVSSVAQSLLLAMLVVDDQKRVTSQACLEHKWMNPPPGQVDSDESSLKPCFPKVANRLQSFGMRSRFEKVVLTLTAHQATTQQVKSLQDIFMLLDKNGDGSLCKTELQSGLASMPETVSLADLTHFQAVFDGLDANYDGKVNYSEWLSATIELSTVASERVMRDLFNFFDVHGDGNIDLDELSQVLDADEAKSILQQGDLSNDGKLSWEEFKRLLLQMAWSGNSWSQRKTNSSPTSV